MTSVCNPHTVCSAPTTAGLLASLTCLRSLELRWFCPADWPQLPLSVRSVSLQLPGCAYGRHRVPLQEEALAELPAAAEAVQQLLAEYEALGPVDPLPEVSVSASSTSSLAKQPQQLHAARKVHTCAAL